MEKKKPLNRQLYSRFDQLKIIFGGKLKEVGTTNWGEPNIGATNETGFTALPSGRRNPMWGYFDVGINGNATTCWRTASNCGGSVPGTASTKEVKTNSEACHINLCGNKSWGFSVRCVKDN